MNALDRKLLRDLWGLKGQATAISFVIAGGVATFIMSATVYDALQRTQSAFYRDYRFADVFVSLKRAPESLKARLQEIPGVLQVETRVVAGANVDVEGYADPVTAQIASLPDESPALLNQVYIRQGRTLDPKAEDEVLISEAFANAHQLHPGDSVRAIINSRRKRLRIVGIALSPQYIYQLQPGSIVPDFKSFGIFWMSRTPLAKAFDMEGAFNDASLSLSRGVQPEEVIDRIDDLLRRYGGLGAYGRKDQVSHRYLSEEFRQLKQMATLFPAIFLSVAAFLLNVALSRLIATQRDQVAILKAFGYSNTVVVVHFLKLAMLIVFLGVGLGIAGGLWLGKGLSSLYMDYYRFPYLLYELRPGVAIIAAGVSLAAAIAGTLYAVIRAASVPPAEAMRPLPPARYRVSLPERLGLARFLSQPTRMIIRNIERRPVKSAFSIIGIAMACAILISGGFFSDSIDYAVNVQFRLSQQDDITAQFVEPTSRSALYSLRSLPGVELTEGFRSVPVRLRFQQRTYRTSLNGIAPDDTLRLLLNKELKPVRIEGEGIVLTDYLAKLLGIQPGDMLTVEVLEGGRPVRQVPLAGTVAEYIGVAAYMSLPALHRLMREGGAISGIYFTIDRAREQEIFSRLKEMPRVVGSTVRRKVLESFYETMAKQMLTFAFFNTLLAGSIAFGVVYNSTRIAFSERSRELASLRVLGFTRGEIAYILLGELGALTLVALPPGMLLGYGLCAFMVANMQTDLYRVPVIIDSATYAMAATVVLVSSVISSLMIKRKLDHLDLVAVLKTKE